MIGFQSFDTLSLSLSFDAGGYSVNAKIKVFNLKYNSQFALMRSNPTSTQESLIKNLIRPDVLCTPSMLSSFLEIPQLENC